MTDNAWIGLGHMGGPMAANLVKVGHHVRGFDIDEINADRARQVGVQVEDSSAGTLDRYPPPGSAVIR